MSMENAILELASALREQAAAIRDSAEATRQGNDGYKAAVVAYATASAQPAQDPVDTKAAELAQATERRAAAAREAQKKDAAANAEAKKNVQAEPTPAEPAAQTTSDPVAPSDAELEAAVTKVEEAAQAEAPPLDYAKDVKPVLLALVKAKQKPALVALLDKYNAKNGEQIKADDFAKIVADANALIAA